MIMLPISYLWPTDWRGSKTGINIESRCGVPGLFHPVFGVSYSESRTKRDYFILNSWIGISVRSTAKYDGSGQPISAL